MSMAAEQVTERWTVWCEHTDGRRYRMGDALETRWSRETAERVAKHMTTYESGVFVAEPYTPPRPPASAGAGCSRCGRALNGRPNAVCPNVVHWHAWSEELENGLRQAVNAPDMGRAQDIARRTLGVGG